MKYSKKKKKNIHYLYVIYILFAGTTTNKSNTYFPIEYTNGFTVFVQIINIYFIYI